MQMYFYKMLFKHYISYRKKFKKYRIYTQQLKFCFIYSTLFQMRKYILQNKVNNKNILLSFVQDKRNI